MSLPQFQLGSFTFLGMNGTPIPPVGVLSLDQRPGVNGTEVTDEGVKGQPFTVRAWKDTTSYSAARTEFQELLLLIRQDPVELVFADISSFIDGYFVKVLSVRPVNIGRIVPGKNGLNPPSLGWLEVDINLIAIEA